MYMSIEHTCVSHLRQVHVEIGLSMCIDQRTGISMCKDEWINL